MNSQPWKIVPATALGKWLVGLIIAMPILFFIGSSFTNAFYASVPSGNPIIEDIAARPALVLTMLAGMAAGVSAMSQGWWRSSKKRERY